MSELEKYKLIIEKQNEIILSLQLKLDLIEARREKRRSAQIKKKNERLAFENKNQTLILSFD